MEEEEEEEEEEDKLWRRRDNFRALETPPPLLPTHKSIRSRWFAFLLPTNWSFSYDACHAHGCSCRGGHGDVTCFTVLVIVHPRLWPRRQSGPLLGHASRPAVRNSGWLILDSGSFYPANADYRMLISPRYCHQDAFSPPDGDRQTIWPSWR